MLDELELELDFPDELDELLELEDELLELFDELALDSPDELELDDELDEPLELEELDAAELLELDEELLELDALLELEPDAFTGNAVTTTCWLCPPILTLMGVLCAAGPSALANNCRVWPGSILPSISVKGPPSME